jgi:uncharacterized protein
MRRRLFLVSIIVACIAALIGVSSASALSVPTAPTLETPIVDQTGTLSTDQTQQLASQIAQSRKDKSYQIGILIIPTLGTDEYLEGYSIKVARTWGIGTADKDNGVLILVVKNDHQMRIEVGRGLEGDLTDLRSGRIVRDVMRPAFQKNDFYGGLSGAITSIQLAVSQKADPALNESQSSSSDGWDTFMTFLVIGAVLLAWLGATLGRSKSWWAGGVVGGAIGVIVMVMFAWAFWTFIVTFFAIGLGLLLDFLVSRNYKAHQAKGMSPSWWAGGGWFGGGGFGGGGGGGSFGGGGFSGGGSSGSW